jgi:hypothetical protein
MTAPTCDGALEALAEIVREHVQLLLDQGHPPSRVSFVLAFVATEMGLELAPDSNELVRLVLGAVLNASSEHAKALSQEDTEPSDEAKRPDTATVH